MKKIIYSSVLIASIFCSCKKNYQCECKNSNATYTAGEIEGTKSQAKKYCDDLSSGDTKCNIK